MKWVFSGALLFSVFLLMACDPTAEPVIEFELIGESIIELGLNEQYIETGYIATINGEQQSVIVSGIVDATVPGTYVITYTLNELELYRTVNVKERLPNYFNEIPPQLIPKVFAQGLISTEEYSEFAGTFSPDYHYYFFTRRNIANDNRLFYSQFLNGEWTEPVLSPISQNVSEMEPYITSDGSTLYFSSKRENHLLTAIYQSNYIDADWTPAIYVDTGLNDQFAMYISVADNHNLYFTIVSSEIMMMPYQNNLYQEPQSTGLNGAHSFIAPDESFMLLDDSGLGFAETSIYISKNIDGKWQSPVKLPEVINKAGYNQICPSISPDGKYLFFTRFLNGTADIYWVSIDILKDYIDIS